MSKTSHYKATTKRGFEAGELAALLASHSPNADYKVVISFRGKVRELIVTEDGSGREAVAGVLHDRDAGGCEPPVIGESYQDGREHGGKVEAAIRFPGLGETTIVHGTRYTRALDGALIASPADQPAPYVDGDAGRVLAKEVPSPATFHGTAATYPPGELTDEALNARFGDPLKGNLDRLHSGERPPGGRTRFADRAHFREEPPFLGKLTAEELFLTEDD